MAEKNKEILNVTGNTCNTILWQDFIEETKKYGFDIVFINEFGGESVTEQEIIGFHKSKGLLLYAESYGGKEVNTAEIYGEVISSIGRLKEEQMKLIKDILFERIDSGNFHIYINAKEEFAPQIDALSRIFGFSKDWSSVPRLWLVNYMEIRNNEDHSKIVRGKIEGCVEEVQKIIFG